MKLKIADSNSLGTAVALSNFLPEVFHMENLNCYAIGTFHSCINIDNLDNLWVVLIILINFGLIK